MAKETFGSLKEFDLVVPAKDLLDAIIVSADAYSRMPMDDERARNMKLTLGFLNAYIKAFHTKTGYFRLTGVADKIKTIREVK